MAPQEGFGRQGSPPSGGGCAAWPFLQVRQQPPPMKRKHGTISAESNNWLLASQSGGSRFTSCPGCGQTVAFHFLNTHLDTRCSSSRPSQGSLQQQWSAPPVTRSAQAPPPRRGALLQQQEQPRSAAQPLLPAPSAPQAPPQLRQPLGATAEMDVGPSSGSPPGEQEELLPPQRRPGKEPMSGEGGSSQASPPGRPQWWQPAPHRAVVATARKANGSRVGLTAEQLRVVAACELITGALPAELAVELLEVMLTQQRGWERMSWWLNGRQGTSAKTSCVYSLAEAAEGWVPVEHVQQVGRQQGQQQQDSGQQMQQQGEAGGRGPWQARDEQQYGGGEPARPALMQLEVAADLITEAVNERIRSRRGQLEACFLDEEDACGWQPSYALVNHYASGAEGVGAHSDRLHSLGPRPIIASLTLGATRTFRLHHTQHLLLPAAAPAAGSSLAHAAAVLATEVVAVDVRLPHNTLVLMWPPCQECWKHEVGAVQGSAAALDALTDAARGCRGGLCTGLRACHFGVWVG